MIAFVIAFLLTLVGTPVVIQFCLKNNLFDKPNKRSSHEKNVPRLGGTLFLPTAFIGVVVAMNMGESGYFFTPPDAVGGALLTKSQFVVKTSTLIIGFCALLIYLVGIIDDLREIKAKQKFMVQAIVALALPACNLYINNLYGLFGIYELSFWMAYPLTVFVILLVVNAINLIDGIDGLASGLSVVMLTLFAAEFHRLGADTYALPAIAIAGSLCAFMLFNIFGSVEHHTKIFMGDGGSLLLGFCLSYFLLKLGMDNRAILPYDPNALFYGITLLFLPTADLARVALERLRQRQPIFQADKRHIHHRLMGAGLTMHQTLLVILGLEVLFCIVNYFCINCLEMGATLTLLLDILIFAFFNLVLMRSQKA